MNTAILRVKYSKLSKMADDRLVVLHKELKDARKAMKDNEGCWEKLADFQEAKQDHLAQKRVAYIYGEMCFDIGD